MASARVFEYLHREPDGNYRRLAHVALATLPGEQNRVAYCHDRVWTGYHGEWCCVGNVLIIRFHYTGQEDLSYSHTFTLMSDASRCSYYVGLKLERNGLNTIFLMNECIVSLEPEPSPIYFWV